jgi:hypothetical protein
MNHPYNLGWPTNPFTKLSPEAMAQLLRDMKVRQREEAEEALV